MPNIKESPPTPGTGIAKQPIVQVAQRIVDTGIRISDVVDESVKLAPVAIWQVSVSRRGTGM